MCLVSIDSGPDIMQPSSCLGLPEKTKSLKREVVKWKINAVTLGDAEELFVFESVGLMLL